jgi:hypothetical protein
MLGDAALAQRRAQGFPDRPSLEVLAEVGRILAEAGRPVGASTSSAVPAAAGGVDGSPGQSTPDLSLSSLAGPSVDGVPGDPSSHAAA